jgi:3-oxoacyl-[acyl-carrier-protein] synthase II
MAADVMVAGAEAAICEIGIAGFNACKALSTNALMTCCKKASRPMTRTVTICDGRKWGIVVLEE